jgi:hypothetical protein
MTTEHLGIFIGRATREHGTSRATHSVISSGRGGEVFTTEVVDLPSGTRVSFDLSAVTGEQLATDVKPIASTPAEPV